MGPRVKHLYTKYVTLSNIGAQENGYKDAGHFRREQYEVEDLENIASAFMDELQPLYRELHGYVRYRLNKVSALLLLPGVLPMKKTLTKFKFCKINVRLIEMFP